MKLHSLLTLIFSVDVNGQCFPVDPSSSSWLYPLDITGGVQYRVRVRAVNAAGEGPYSTAATFRLPAPPPAPPVLEMVECQAHSIKIRWQYAPTEAAVEHELAMVAPGKKARVVTAYKGPALQFRASRLQHCQLYRFRVRGFNESGWGPFSAELQAYTLPEPLTAAPLPSAAVQGDEALLRFENNHERVLEMRCLSHATVVLVDGTAVEIGPAFTAALQGTASTVTLRGLPTWPIEVRVCCVRGGQHGPFSDSLSIQASLMAPAPKQEAQVDIQVQREEPRNRNLLLFAAVGAAVVAVVVAMMARLL